MASAGNSTGGTVNAFRFSGHSTGLVKSLGGFVKGRHKLPDAITPTTLSFLAKLCADELAQEAEDFFQRARTLCAYKRKDLELSVASPLAQLTAKDFTFELLYGFDGDDPESYRIVRTLQGISELDFLHSQPCRELFSERFDELIFSLVKGAPVEKVIDAIEDLEDTPLRVDYPSDCSHCILSVEGVDAKVRFDGAELSMLFDRQGAPGDLLDAFNQVRAAFRLSRDKALSGLLG